MKNAKGAKNPEFLFRVLVERVEDQCVAYCLEMGLVATHDQDDVDELLSRMSKMVVRQLEFAIENDNMSDIYHPAPADIWRKFREAESEAEAETDFSSKRKIMGDRAVEFEQRAYVACPA